MSTHLGLREKAVGGFLNIFDSDKIRWVTGGVTIAESTVTAVSGKKVLKIGTPLGKITAGADAGKYGPYNKTGRNTSVVLLGQEIDFSLGEGMGFGDQLTTAFDWARVIEERVDLLETGEDLDDLKALLPGITFV